MQKESIISKGKYSFPQAENIVSVKQYFFVRDEKGQKRLLLRFFNDRDELCTKFAFVIRFLDSRGKVIDEEKFETGNVSIKGKGSYSFDEAIFVNERCTTFKVEVLYASYGNYKYVNDNNNVSIEYSNQAAAVPARMPKHSSKPRSIRARVFKMPWIYVAISLLILTVAILTMCIHLYNFMDEEDEFTLSGVEYEFVSKKEGTVRITGYTGTYTNILIPSEIEGYDVVGIKDGAFRNNDKIKKVRIEGVNIGTSVFKGCDNLVEVQIDSISSIGEDAFKNCSSLKKITITYEENNEVEDEEQEPEILKIGRCAFENCTSLSVVSIDQLTSFVNDYTIFKNDYAISELYLKNFAYELEGSYPSQETSITHLVTTDYYPSQTLQLKKISIGYIDKVYADFCKEFTLLESFEITESPVSTIGANAFNGCVSLRTLNFKYPIRIIEKGAFAYTKITSFNASEVSSVGDSAFFGCNQLAQFNLAGNNTIKSIGDSAFENCTSLQSIILPSTLTELGECAFASTGLKTFKFTNSDLEIKQGVLRGCKDVTELDLAELPGDCVGYMFLDPDEDIPSYIDGEDAANEWLADKYAKVIPANLIKITLSGTATELKKLAFAGCKSLQALSLPTGIISIEDYAFADCQKLVDINLGDTVEQIGKYAFKNTGITAFVLPKSMTSVPEGMFLDCNNLESVTLHENVTSIGKEAFKNCELITELQLYSASTFGDWAFVNTGLKKITIPANAEKIGTSILEECTSLEEITVPLTEGIFVGYPQAEINNYFTEYGVGTTDATDGIVKITINAGNIIQRYSFEDISDVKEIVLENGITEVRAYAFIYMTNLRRLVLPETLIEDGFDTESVYTYYDGDAYRLYEICNPSSCKIDEDLLPNTIEITTSKDQRAPNVTIDGYEFAKYKDEWYLVNWDDSITDFAPPSTFTYVASTEFSSIEEDVVSWHIAPSLFRETSKITKMTFPSSLQSIGYRAFKYCGAEEIIFNSDAPINTIGEECFYGASLKSITLPNKVEDIGYSAFAYCYNLEQITFPTELLSVADYAFGNCTSLECITLNEKLTSLSTTAFADCGSIYDIYNLSVLDIVEGSTAYSGIARRAFVHTSIVDSRSQEATVSGLGKIRYCGNEWIILSFDTTLTSIDTTKFKYNSITPTEIRILEDVYSYSNSSLLKLIIGDNVTQIQSGAFDYCSMLTEADLSQNTRITELAANTFKACNNLATVKLPVNLVSIGADAFYGCKKLLSIQLPSTLQEIGYDAFYGCEQLFEVYDLSSYIYVDKNTSNGYVGYYAKEIFTDTSDALERYEIDGFYFVVHNNNYYLHHYNGNARIITIPEINGADIIILGNAFFGLGANGIILHTNVTEIEADGYNCDNIGKIYYLGTSDDWYSINITGDYYLYNSRYYYDTCVHSSGVWTYVDGKPSTSYCELEWNITTAPTCYSYGTNTGVCKCEGCKYFETSDVSMVDHSFKDGKCIYCEKQYIKITPENVESYDSFEFNAEIFVMDEEGKMTTQGAAKDQTAYVEIYANEELSIKYSCGLQSEEYSYMRIYRVYDSGYDSTVKYLYYGNTQDYTIVLQEGETLVFEYRIASESEDSYAYLNYIEILLK